MRKNIVFILLLAGVLILSSCSNKTSTASDESDKIKVVSTIFPGYDFAREIGGDRVELELLIAPGAEIHSFEPTAKQIQRMKESDVLILVGSPDETWADRFLEENTEINAIVIKLVDVLEGEHEEQEDEEGHIHLADEHVWTSPRNVIKLSDDICRAFSEKDSASTGYFEERKASFTEELEDLDSDFRDAILSSKRKTIVVADRFPFTYFVEEYGLDYYAAFEGCSHDSQESAKTVSEMIKHVKEEKIPYVYKIELSNGNIANAVSQSTGAQILELHSAQNVTKEEFESGITYLDIMRSNLEAIKKD